MFARLQQRSLRPTRVGCRRQPRMCQSTSRPDVVTLTRSTNDASMKRTPSKPICATFSRARPRPARRNSSPASPARAARSRASAGTTSPPPTFPASRKRCWSNPSARRADPPEPRRSPPTRPRRRRALSPARHRHDGARSDGLVKANEEFAAWLLGERSMPFGANGEHVTIRLIDFDDIEQNSSSSPSSSSSAPARPRSAPIWCCWSTASRWC